MDKSNSIAGLAAALSAAQSELRPAAMNATNPFLKNKYADLGSVIEVARPVLAAHGLAVSQHPCGTDGRIEVETILMHSSGEWIASRIGLPALEERGKSGAQVAGSIITYLRRYAFAAVLGIYADEDTDGSHPEPKRAPKQASAQSEPAPIETGEAMTARTRGRLFALFTERGIDDRDTQIRGIGAVIGRTVESRADLTEAEARRVIASLEGAR